MATTTATATAPFTLIVGLGQTGMSCARYLAAHGVPFAVVDSREAPPALETLRHDYPDTEVHLGNFDSPLFQRAELLLVSPGVSLDEPALVAAREAGVELIGDIELFARAAEAPVVAITGSNGKSTVTTLVGEMAREAGLNVKVGGNIGTPALDLLDGEVPDLYILELSSFQLELTESLEPEAAVVLNVSDDHLDRHGTLKHYAALKQRVYRGRGTAVINLDDPVVAKMAKGLDPHLVVGYSLREPQSLTDYGLLTYRDDLWLARGQEPLLRTRKLHVAGRHNLANALAALALGAAVSLPREAMLSALRHFTGLSHRCQWVAGHDGVDWYNDSKGTNVGATVAALEGMPGSKVVLIAGGRGKGADFAPMVAPVREHARAVVVIGEEAPRLAELFSPVVTVERADTMADAVAKAAVLAKSGDSVLLSPACASFDMFSNYIERGEAFVAAVQEVTA